MFLKITGLLLVMAASTLIGFKAAQSIEGRLKDLRDIGIALQILEREMVFLAKPLPEALLSASKIKSNVSTLFKECGEMLSSKMGFCISDAWDACINKNFMNTFLNEDDKQILLNLGKSLGSYDIQNQTQNIRLIISQLLIQEKKAEEAILKSAKMYKNLGVLAGAAIVIVLL